METIIVTMKSIYDIISESQNVESVWVVKGPDGSIASVWATEKEAKEDCDKMNKEVKGDSFKVEKDKASEYVK